MSPKPKPKAAPQSEDTGFDARLTRLQALVVELEEGDLGLEPAIERYQEGVALLKACQESLASFKKRVEELTGEADAALRPYADDPDVDDSDGDGD